MAEDNLEPSRSASSLFILANKAAADRRLHTEHVEEFCTDLQAFDVLCALIVNERVIAAAITRDAFEGVVPIPEIEKVRIRHRIELARSARVLSICTANSNKTVRRWKRQRL